MQNKSIGHSLWSCNKVYIPPRQEKEEKKIQHVLFILCLQICHVHLILIFWKYF